MNFELYLLVPLLAFQTPAVAADSIHLILILRPAYKSLFMDEVFREGTLWLPYIMRALLKFFNILRSQDNQS